MDNEVDIINNESPPASIEIKLILDAIDEAVVWTDKVGKIIWYNHAFQNFAKPLSEILLGHTFESIILLTQNGKKIKSENYPHHQSFEFGKTYHSIYECEYAKKMKTIKVSSFFMPYTSDKKYVITVINTVAFLKQQTENSTALSKAQQPNLNFNSLANLAQELNQALVIIHNNMLSLKSVTKDQLSQQDFDQIANSTISCANKALKALSSFGSDKKAT